MVVISDTTAITNLIKIDLLDILSQLYGEVFIPKAVYEELCRYNNQKEAIDSLPWIKTIQLANSELLSSLFGKLDKGEAEAIVLALEMEADYLKGQENRKTVRNPNHWFTGYSGLGEEGKTH